MKTEFTLPTDHLAKNETGNLSCGVICIGILELR